jgi:hypothetical protein
MKSLIYILTTAMLLVRCSPTDPTASVGKPGEETTNGVVMGSLFDANGIPTVGTEVDLYAVVDSALDSVTAVAGTITDQHGSFRFEGLPEGVFQIAAFTGDERYGAVSGPVEVTEQHDTVSVRDTVVPTSSLQGVVDLTPGPDLYASVVLRNTPFSVTPDISGRFFFRAIPAGTYEIRCIVRSNPDRAAIVAQKWVTIPQEPDSITIDTLRIPAFIDESGTILLEDFDDGILDDNPHVRWSAKMLPDDTITTAKIDSFGIVTDTGSGSPGSLHAAYTGAPIDEPGWLSIKANLSASQFNNRPQTVVDMSRLSAISFRARGTGHMLKTRLHTNFPAGYYTMFSIESLPEEWTRYRVDVDSVVQAMTPSERTEWDIGKQFIVTLQFPVIWPESINNPPGELWLDDIELTFK